MSGADFKIIIDRIKETNGVSKAKIARQIGVSIVTLNNYLNQGIPVRKTPLVMHRLKVFV
jgi:lambda repressor-like predicted transcriptional regulator